MYSLGYSIQVAIGCMAWVIEQNAGKDSDSEEECKEIAECIHVIANWFNNNNIENAD